MRLVFDMISTPSPTLLVMAAGLGSRYGGLKQLDPVGPGGETLIDYSIYDAIRAGFSRVVFVIRKEIESAFQETVAARFASHIAMDYVFQELDSLPSGFVAPHGRTRPWGTAHALLLAAEAIQAPFTVINADDFYGAESMRIAAQHLRSGSPEHAMVAFPLRNTLSPFGTVSRGICEVDGSGHLRGIAERTRIAAEGGGACNMDPDGHVTLLTGDELVSMNARLVFRSSNISPGLPATASPVSSEKETLTTSPPKLSCPASSTNSSPPSARARSRARDSRFLVWYYLSRRLALRRREYARPDRTLGTPIRERLA